MYYKWDSMKKLYAPNKFEILGSLESKELPKDSYHVSGIQYYLE